MQNIKSKNKKQQFTIFGDVKKFYEMFYLKKIYGL